MNNARFQESPRLQPWGGCQQAVETIRRACASAAELEAEGEIAFVPFASDVVRRLERLVTSEVPA